MLYLILKRRGCSALRGGGGLIVRAAGGGWCLMGGEWQGQARVAEQRCVEVRCCERGVPGSNIIRGER
jgi:hypothetical protein